MIELILLLVFTASLGLTMNNLIDWIFERFSKRYFLVWYMGQEVDGSVSITTNWGKFLNLKEIKNYIHNLGEKDVMITNFKEVSRSEYNEWIRDITPVKETTNEKSKNSEDVHISDENMKAIINHQIKKNNKPN